MDLLLWGLTSLYIATANNQNHVIAIILTGVILWNVIWRVQYEITTNVMSEFWDKNLINIFVSPLTIYEWMVSFIIVGFVKMLVTLLFTAFLAFLMYHFNIFIYGFFLLPFLFSLLLTGWAVGFFISGFLIRYGTRIQTLAWTGIAILAPFSAPYYSLSILPAWARNIAHFIPTSYVFEGLREVLLKGKFDKSNFITSMELNIVYLALGIGFFIFMFKKTKKIGFGKLI
jgi:ABC-2 type transport system permease protein